LDYDIAESEIKKIIASGKDPKVLQKVVDYKKSPRIPLVLTSG